MKVLAPGTQGDDPAPGGKRSQSQPAAHLGSGSDRQDELTRATSHAVLWPVVAQLGAPGLALVTVTGG
jgi:hypothetical protein